jgi:hypothetical protein
MLSTRDEAIHQCGCVAAPKPWVKDWMLALITLAIGDTLLTKPPLRGWLFHDLTVDELKQIGLRYSNGPGDEAGHAK